MRQVLSPAYGVENPQNSYLKLTPDSFRKISPKKAKSDFKGKVKTKNLSTKRDEEEGNYDEIVLSKLPALVMELQDHGYEVGDIPHF